MGTADRITLETIASAKRIDTQMQAVRNSEFGCRNCLWAGTECNGMAKYQPHTAMGKPSCKAYDYYD